MIFATKQQNHENTVQILKNVYRATRMITVNNTQKFKVHV